MTRLFLDTLMLLIAATSVAWGQLNVISPNGGETFFLGETMTIRWTGVPATDTVRIELFEENKNRWKSITDTATGLAYAFTFGSISSGSPRRLVRVTLKGDTTQSDVSDDYWELYAARITATQVDFGNVAVGSLKDTTIECLHNVTNDTLVVESITMEELPLVFEILEGGPPFILGPHAGHVLKIRFKPTRELYEWPLVMVGYLWRFQKQWMTGRFLRGTGVPATDTMPKLLITHPNGGEAFGLGDTLTFRWENNPPDNFVMLQYSPDKGTSWITIADSITGNDYQWVIPRAQSNNCLARIVPKGPAAVRGDTSDAIWKLDVPRADVYDHYDMPEAKVGESVTAVSDLFVKNRSAAKLYVESIWIEGDQASEYEIISGEAPFLLESGQRWAVGFRFTPKGAGLRVADAVTASRDADTVRTELRGIGISETSDVPETGERPILAAESTSLQMQPNPAQSDALIQYRLDEATRVRLRIYNSLGEAVETLVEGEEGAGRHLVHIDVGGLASGIYIVVLETESGRQTRTVMVER